MKKPILLMILDGLGLSVSEYGNAVAAANIPFLRSAMSDSPFVSLEASGLDVGLPEGQMGNSEVGHTNIGAGRVVYQELTRISKSIRDGDFFENPVLCEAIDSCVKKNTTLHLIGLLSDGGVHSHNNHLYALCELAQRKGAKNVNIHALLDGRDVDPVSGKGFVEELAGMLEQKKQGRIATVMGRYYAMDRDNRWERVRLAWDAIVRRKGNLFNNPVEAVEASYDNDVMDEFMIPAVVEGGEPVRDGDSVIFFNFRPDRARELTRAFVDDAFGGFDRGGPRPKTHFACMTQYDVSMPNVSVAFRPDELKNTLGEYLSALGLSQLRIAETEKYAHVTFFFSGGREKPFKGEDRCLVPSPKVATYDLQPEMSAPEVTEEVVRRLASDRYNLIVLNFANCDMVGHSGDFEATVKAVETVDGCAAKVAAAVEKAGGICIITADHGNAERKKNPDGSPITAHTTNRVPFIVLGKDCKLRSDGGLADIAPTILDIMSLPVPPQMTGKSLVVG